MLGFLLEIDSIPAFLIDQPIMHLRVCAQTPQTSTASTFCRICVAQEAQSSGNFQVFPRFYFPSAPQISSACALSHPKTCGSLSGCGCVIYRISVKFLASPLVHCFPNQGHNLRRAKLPAFTTRLPPKLLFLLTKLLGMVFVLFCFLCSKQLAPCNSETACVHSLPFLDLLHSDELRLLDGSSPREHTTNSPLVLPNVQPFFMNKCFSICSMSLVNFKTSGMIFDNSVLFYSCSLDLPTSSLCHTRSLFPCPKGFLIKLFLLLEIKTLTITQT